MRLQPPQQRFGETRLEAPVTRVVRRVAVQVVLCLLPLSIEEELRRHKYQDTADTTQILPSRVTVERFDALKPAQGTVHIRVHLL